MKKNSFKFDFHTTDVVERPKSINFIDASRSISLSLYIYIHICIYICVCVPVILDFSSADVVERPKSTNFIGASGTSEKYSIFSGFISLFCVCVYFSYR